MSGIPLQLRPWMEHLKKVQEQTGLTGVKLAVEAKKTYSRSKTPKNKPRQQKGGISVKDVVDVAGTVAGVAGDIGSSVARAQRWDRWVRVLNKAIQIKSNGKIKSFDDPVLADEAVNVLLSKKSGSGRRMAGKSVFGDIGESVETNRAKSLVANALMYLGWTWDDLNNIP